MLPFATRNIKPQFRNAICSVPCCCLASRLGHRFPNRTLLPSSMLHILGSVRLYNFLFNPSHRHTQKVKIGQKPNCLPPCTLKQNRQLEKPENARERQREIERKKERREALKAISMSLFEAIDHQQAHFAKGLPASGTEGEGDWKAT